MWTLDMTPQLASIQELAIEIGDTPILLRRQDERFWQIVQQRYSGFVRDGVEPAVTFNVDVVDPEESLSDGELRVWTEGGLWRLERGDFRVEWDPRLRHGQILQTATPYAIDTALRVVHTILQAPGGWIPSARGQRDPEWTRVSVFWSFRFRTASEFLERVPAFHLTFYPDGRVWDLIQ
jgi:hypothetical protein